MRPRLSTLLLLVLGSAALAIGGSQPRTTPGSSPEALLGEAELGDARRRMVAEGIVGWGIEDPAVIDVMGRVPRHEYVPAEYLDQAYENHPLPIGYGQTISQPYIVALMTQALEIEPGDRVLEIGTGSGYQAAVLAELGAQVFTIEIVGPLADQAAQRLRRYPDVTTRHGDGYEGWPAAAPFEAIIVTAAPDHVPPPLLEQLAVGGNLVIPVGPVGDYQELWRVSRLSAEDYRSVSLGGVRFVPLLRSDEVPE